MRYAISSIITCIYHKEKKHLISRERAGDTTTTAAAAAAATVTTTVHSFQLIYLFLSFAFCTQCVGIVCCHLLAPTSHGRNLFAFFAFACRFHDNRLLHLLELLNARKRKTKTTCTLQLFCYLIAPPLNAYFDSVYLDFEKEKNKISKITGKCNR